MAARSLAAALTGAGRTILDQLGAVPFGRARRGVADHTRAVYRLLQAWLTARLAAAHDRRARRAAGLARAHQTVRRWRAGIRLPAIPGGDPVVFGAAVGAAIILGAAVIVLVGTSLREYRSRPQTAVALSDRASVEAAAQHRQAPVPLAETAAQADRKVAVTWAEHNHADEITEPVPMVALAPDPADGGVGGASADDDENIAAAMRLLDMPADQSEELAPSPSELPMAPPPQPFPEARPPAPATQPQWLANAVEPQRRPGDRPMIAIVIDDAGVAQARTARAIELPAPLTIAFIPYSGNLKEQTRRARRNGHELLLHIPMEPDSSAVDPGPNALLTTLDGDEIMRRFEWALSRFDGYVGVNNHMGSKFMARADLVAPLLAEMNARGLMFLDSRTDKSTVGAELARRMDVPHVSRQVFLDNDLDAGMIAAQLKRLEDMARHHGHAIAIGHPHDVTVDVLAHWIPEARARGFDLVPVTAIVKLAYGDDSKNQLAAARSGEADGLLGGAQ